MEWCNLSTLLVLAFVLPPRVQGGSRCGHLEGTAIGTDSGGDTCQYYVGRTHHCGCCDTARFRARDCCECQGAQVVGNATFWAEVLYTWPRKATSLWLPEKGIEGELPTDIAERWPHLRTLNLAHNKLTGSLPSGLGKLTRLAWVFLNANQLSGSLPPELGDLTNLTELRIQDNQLSGDLPPWLGNLTSLEVLYAWQNRFTGVLPLEICRLERLCCLGLSVNKLKGTIPSELGLLENLVELYLDWNQFSGGVPPELGNLSSLEFVWLNNNELSGPLPPQLGQARLMKELWLSHNHFSGGLPPELKSMSMLRFLFLEDNQFSGHLPPDLGNLTSLKKLRVQTNNFTGSLPPELGNLVHLEELDLSGNRFSGHLPSELGSLRSLLWIRMAENQLSGGLPPSFNHLQVLHSIYAAGNPELCGEAGVLEELPSLVHLDLARCCFTAEDLEGLPPRLQHLDLTGNKLSSIPRRWQPDGHPLRTLLISANALGWDRSSIVPYSYNSGEGWNCGFSPEGERLAFLELERLEVSSNPLGVTIYEFLESLSHLPKLTLLRARDANLTGLLPLLASDLNELVPNMPNTGNCADEFPGSDRLSFPALLTLDLSGNAITAVNSPPSSRLMQADLSRNALIALNPAWWHGGSDGSLQNVDARDNPELRLPVALDAGAMCPTVGAAKLTASDSGWSSSGNQTAACTTVCRMEHTRFQADVTLNESVLCRCSQGHGIGQDCHPCPDDTYSSLSFQSGQYSRRCLNCPVDSSLPGGQGLCFADCACRAGHVMVQISSGLETGVEVGATPCERLVPTAKGMCEPCGPFKTSLQGSRKRTDCFCHGNVSSGGWAGLLERDRECMCPQGFHMSFASRSCLPCRNEEDCGEMERSLQPPTVKSGFWALPPPPQDAAGMYGNFSRHVIWRCRSTAACPGNGTCGMNLVGVACSLCKQGYFRTGSGSCARCPRPHDEARLLLAMLLLGSTAFPMLAHATLSASQESRGLFMTLRSFRTSLRQLVKFGQVLGLVSLFRVEWPPLVLSVFVVFRAFSLDFASWTRVACLDAQQQQSVTLELAFRWLLPVAGVVITCLAALIVTFCNVVGTWVLAPCWTRWSGMETPLRQFPSFRLLDVLRVLLFFLHLLFPSLLQNSLLPLTCSPSPNGHLTMNSYPHRICWSATNENDAGEFWPLAVAGLIQSILLSLGFPLVLFFAWRSMDTSSTFLVGRRPNTSSERLEMIEERRRWWLFVFEDFRPHKTFWPLEALGKDILINFVVVVLPGFGTAQLLLTSVISITYACRAFTSSPYRDVSNTLLETCTAASIAALCIFSAGMGFQSEPDVMDLGHYIAGGRSGPGYLQRAVTLVSLQGLSLVGPVTILAFQLLMAFPRSRRLIPACLKPLSDDERTSAMQCFSGAMELRSGPLPHVLSELDHLDFSIFMRTVSSAPLAQRLTRRFGSTQDLKDLSNDGDGDGNSNNKELNFGDTNDPEAAVATREIAALQQKIAALSEENTDLHAEKAELQADLHHSQQETERLRLVIAARDVGADAALPPRPPPLPSTCTCPGTEGLLCAHEAVGTEAVGEFLPHALGRACGASKQHL